MWHELIIDNTDISSLEIKEKEKHSAEYSKLVTLPSYLTLLKKKCTCLIGFPFSVSNTDLRLNEIEYAIKNGASGIDLIINQRLLLDKDTEGIYKDYLDCKNLCRENGLELRCVIEYRLNTNRMVIEISKILENAGLKKLILGVIMPDNTTDLILLCQDLIKNTNLEIIVGVSELNDEVISSLSKLGVSGVRKRLCSIHS